MEYLNIVTFLLLVSGKQLKRQTGFGEVLEIQKRRARSGKNFLQLIMTKSDQLMYQCQKNT
jgi:hypothetical protein